MKTIKRKFLAQILVITVILMSFLPLSLVGVSAEEYDVTLSDIEFDNHSVFGFDPNQATYSVQLPYRYVPNSKHFPVPKVRATTADPNAKVVIQRSPDGSPIILTVFSPDESISKEYTLNVETIGRNQIENHGMESDISSSWYIYNHGGGQTTISRSTEQKYAGEYSLYVQNTYQAYTYHGQPKYFTTNKTYITSIAAKRAEAGEVRHYEEYTDNRTGIETVKKYWDANGINQGNGLFPAEDKNGWQRGFTTVSYKQIDGSDAKWLTSNFTAVRSAVGKSTWFDEQFFGELVIGDVIVDGERSIEKIGETQTFQYTAKLNNQFGMGAGLQDETIDKWVLINAPEGVSIDEQTGVLTVLPTVRPGTFCVEAQVIPTYVGALQPITGGRLDVTIGTEGLTAKLSDIEVNGHGVSGFTGNTAEYTVDVPYKYVRNGNCFAVPTVTATAIDPKAQIGITYPDTVEGGSILINVTESTGVLSKQYKLNLNPIGKNLYDVDGDCEEIDKWTVLDGKVTFGRDTNNVWAGNASLRIDRTSAYGAYRRVPYPQVSPNKVYLASSMVRTETAPHETSNIMDGINTGAKAGTISYWSENGTELTNRGHAINLTTDWQRTCMAFTYTGSDTYAVKHYYTNWDKEPVILVDDYYVGELVIADVVVKDTNNAAEGEIDVPSSENTTIQLSANMSNQFGTKSALSQTVSWRTVDEHSGVTVNSTTGVVTVEPDAKIGKAIIEAVVTPTYAGAVQSEVLGRYKLTINGDDEIKYYAGSEEITQICTGDIIAKLRYTNTADDDIRFINVVYEQVDGKLIITNLTIEDLSGLYIDTTRTIAVPNDAKKYVIKSFVWSNANLKPLMINGELK